VPSLFVETFDDVAMPIFESWFGVTVSLTVGLNTTDTFTAIGSDREYESVELETGLPIKIVSRDWKLPAALLVIDSATVVPKAGNVITEGSDEYEIVPIAGRPAVELQEGEYRYLVHSQRITS